VSITYSIDRKKRRLTAVATGAVTYPEVLAHLEMERRDGGLPLQELIDGARATAALSAADVREIVQRLREVGRLGALGPTAIVVHDDASYGMMRMLEILVEDVCDVRPFRDRAEAEAWLEARK
jgi:hypothetical protein